MNNLLNEFRKINIINQVTRINNYADNQILPFQNQVYSDIKRDCLRNKKLFVDPLFPSNDRSLFYKTSTPPGISWKRAKDIALSRNLQPKFIENTANANDLDQGYIGDCWFIAGCAGIAAVPEIFLKVVPHDQGFDEQNYAGIFHFRFWLYGTWYDVVIDDLLPVWRDGSLVFCKNSEEPNEFWSALIEKAYAKIYGSYENLDGGFTSDSLIDMSGGIQDTLSIRDLRTEQERSNIWHLIVKSRQLKSITAAFLEPDPRIKEDRLTNGLVLGHAYTITKIASIEDIKKKEIKLIRLRNPWGNDIEWKGPWSDKSGEWHFVSNEVKSQLGFTVAGEGEFWMSFDDFMRNFHNLQFCYLTPDAFSDEVASKKNKAWKMVAYHGSWINGKTAGGCGQGDPAAFWMNPQFLVTLTQVDSDSNKCTIIVALMQKYTREKRMKVHQDSLEDFIQFRVYKIKENKDVEIAKRNAGKLYASQLEKYGSSEAYINRREITKRFELPPGNYLIIPSCFDNGHEGDFLLRIFTENAIEERNTQILTEDKKNLTDSDIYFFKDVNVDQSFSSWLGFIDESSSGPTAHNDVPKPTTSNTSISSGFNRITGVLVGSALNTDKTDKRSKSPSRFKNAQLDFNVQKVIAKFENKKTVKESCNVM